MDERAEALEREQAIRDANRTPKEIGGIAPVAAAATKQEAQPEASAETPVEEGIMVPKWRFDEINSKYQQLRNAPPTASAQPEKGTPTPTIDEAKVKAMVDSQLAPLRVQMEVDQVLKAHEDFAELAPKVMERIKSKPALTLEEAYQLEKFSQIESSAKEEGKKEAYEVIEKKASLQVEHSGRKAIQRSVEEMIQDKSIPLNEIAQLLRQQ